MCYVYVGGYDSGPSRKSRKSEFSGYLDGCNTK